MFKRILKIVGICLGAFVGAVGLGFGIYAIAGGFKKETITVEALYFGSREETSRVVYSLEDVPLTINCYPDNATDKELELKITDDVGVLQDPPKTVKAGEEFTLKIRKDENGNHVGGVVNITATKGVGHVAFTLICDVPVPDDVVFFSDGRLNKEPMKNYQMAVSKEGDRYIYLNSSLVNAFYLDAGKDGVIENLKNIEIGYDYYSRPTAQEPSKLLKDQCKVFGANELVPQKASDGKYYFQVPVEPSTPGTIVVKARMHRTKQIQDEYIAKGFKELETAIKDMEEADAIKNLISEYSQFFNTYIKYFDIDDDDYKEMNENNMIALNSGKVTFSSLSHVQSSLKYVFVTTETTIEVLDATVNGITSADAITLPFSAQTTEKMNLEKVVEKFNLNATIYSADTNKTFPSSDYSYFRNKLSLIPTIYFSKEKFAEVKSEWIGYPTYEVLETSNGFPSKIGEEPIIYDEEGDQSGIEGYLVKLTTLTGDKENKKVNYFGIQTDGYDAKGLEQWKFSFNVPKISSLDYSLIVMFEMTNEDINTQKITKYYNFTQISIGYKEATYNQTDMMRFENFNPSMVINSGKIQNQGNLVNKQDLTLANNRTNTPTYTKVMYFVEKSSNVASEGDGEEPIKRVVSTGTYTFFDIKTQEEITGLVGERIHTYNTTTNKFYLRAINVTTNDEFVKVFAVVYLTDAEGNAIDINGNIIDFSQENAVEVEGEEGEDGEETGAKGVQLVVVEATATDVSNMQSVSIDCLPESVNFYTQNLIEDENLPTWTDDADNTFEFSGKRNILTKDYSANASAFINLGNTTKGINNFLKLKLLYDSELTLYASNGSMTMGDNIDVTFDDITTSAISSASDYLVNAKGEHITDNSKYDYAIDNATNQAKAFVRLKESYSLNLLGTDASGKSYAESITINNVSSADDEYLTFTIKVENVDIAEQGSTMKMFASGNEPYADIITESRNTVDFIVKKLSVSGVRLTNSNQYNININAQYSDNPSSKGLTFTQAQTTSGNVSTQDGEGSQTPPATSNSDFSHGTLDMSEIYSLYSGDVVNLENVDASQADINTLKTYVDNKKNDAGVGVYHEYTIASTIYQLGADLIFTAKVIDDECVLNINGKTITSTEKNDGTDTWTFIFPGGEEMIAVVDTSVVSVLEEGDGDTEGDGEGANGSEEGGSGESQPPVNTAYKLVVPAGKCMPGISLGGKKYAYLLGELFEIRQEASGSDIRNYIYSDTEKEIKAPVNENIELYSANGEKITFENNKYLKAFDKNTFTPTFSYGEEVATFEPASTGATHKFEDGKYVEVDTGATHKITSITGVDAFLIITSTSNDGEIFVNCIRYNIYQENIDLSVGYAVVHNNTTTTPEGGSEGDSQGGASIATEGDSTDESNSNITTEITKVELAKSRSTMKTIEKFVIDVPDNYYDFNVSTSIPTSEGGYIFIDSENNPTFFRHVTFEIIERSPGVKFLSGEPDSNVEISGDTLLKWKKADDSETQSDISSFRIQFNPSQDEQYAYIEMTYEYKGVTETRILAIEIMPNYEFEFVAPTTGLGFDTNDASNNDKMGKATLIESGDKYYLDMPSNYSVALEDIFSAFVLKVKQNGQFVIPGSDNTQSGGAGSASILTTGSSGENEVQHLLTSVSGPIAKTGDNLQSTTIYDIYTSGAVVNKYETTCKVNLSYNGFTISIDLVVRVTPTYILKVSDNYSNILFKDGTTLIGNAFEIYEYDSSKTLEEIFAGSPVADNSIYSNLDISIVDGSGQNTNYYDSATGIIVYTLDTEFEGVLKITLKENVYGFSKHLSAFENGYTIDIKLLPTN
ncbi:MAG: hypothetical protein E7345_01890 [Clostridiales bacterium]|nr:hypothetical protein [Clostridiales bacterium]